MIKFRMMNKWIAWGLLLGLLWLTGWVGLPVQAKDLARQTAIAKTVSLGTLEGSLRFEPSSMEFKVGQLYDLTLTNPSPVKHYFTAKNFADAIWTRKVEVAGAEIKGHINNVELKPDAELEWLFVPLQAGTYELECTIPGHAAAGMVGSITVVAS